MLASLQLNLEIILACLTSFGILFYGACALFTVLFFSRTPDRPNPVEKAASIIIPVRGVDEGAWENWDSFCHQDYDRYEVLFGVMDTTDPAVPLLEKLAQQYPDRVRLLTNLAPRGINYQISNLSYLVEAAQYEYIVFADSDIQVTPDYLQWVTSPLKDPAVGMVTCGYLDHHPKRLGAAIASLGRGLDFIPSVLIARALDGGMKFALGPTIATRQSVLQKVGGLQKVLNCIGSDFQMGRLAVDAGYRVELSPYILENNCGAETVAQVLQRELRWSRTIRWNRGREYYGILFTHGTVYGCLLMIISGFQPWAVALGMTALGVRWLQGLVSCFMLRSPGLIPWLWVLPLRDWMTGIIWLMGCYGQHIVWRGRTLQKGVDFMF